jgi:hypothetical protein
MSALLCTICQTFRMEYPVFILTYLNEYKEFIISEVYLLLPEN